jgi:diacylglycerol kinase (ATP)
MKKFLNSFLFALRGIRFAWAGTNFRIQCFIGTLVIASGIKFDIRINEWFVVIILIGLVLTAEVFNTAIENLVNFISPDFHPLAGKVKDLAAGAVLVLSFASLLIGLIIFVPYLNIF